MKRITIILSVFSLFLSGFSKAQEHDAYETGINEVTVLLKFRDLNGNILAGESMTIFEFSSGNSKIFKSSPVGTLILKGLSGSVFDISFKYNPHYLIIDTKQYQERIIEILVTYEGTAELERQKIEREKFEKMARERWGSTNAEGFKKDLENYSNGKYKFQDEVFLKVLKRNVKWKNKLIVCDITGSMYPYIGQVLLWYKLNYADEKTTQLCFFNDGDSKSEDQKTIGNTGGIYYCDKCEEDSLTDVMVRAMVGGCGGDAPENDLEALIKASNKMKDFKELILVADNNSDVKDIALLKELKIPVRVIVCGSNNRVASDYLEIAYKTKGSVHTIEEDIETVSAMKEGSEIKIGGRKYKLRKGEFILINKG
ncbi:hypothetical protein [Aurantibacillus circumpalustris]|uniref:hypothetical protein n=1 Tax=Aurantibacillus circumpalustris TaxID=3036359 RepID=UPI00295C33E2|nr:hypothetical protein [Aurantibacillus circumpalustris]